MNKKLTIFTMTLASLLILSGCSQDATSTEGTDYLLAGYYMMAGEETPIAEDGASRATVPVHDTSYDDKSFTEWAASTTKINNYPERGQKTYVTVTVHDAPNDIYLVSSRTEYPKKDELFEYYLEEYYIEDVGGEGDWTTADVIVDASGNPDPYYRKTMEVVFKDGSIRKEWIEDIPDSASTYANFDIDGDMSIPESITAPEVDASNVYSSEVHYYQRINNWISWFYKENKETFGVRYYTEDADDLRTSLAYEHTISQNVPASWSDNSRISDLLDYIFNRSSASGSETLSETVIRYQIASNGKKTVKSATTVVPTFGDTFTINNEIAY